MPSLAPSARCRALLALAYLAPALLADAVLGTQAENLCADVDPDAERGPWCHGDDQPDYGEVPLWLTGIGACLGAGVAWARQRHRLAHVAGAAGVVVAWGAFAPAIFAVSHQATHCTQAGVEIDCGAGQQQSPPPIAPPGTITDGRLDRAVDTRCRTRDAVSLLGPDQMPLLRFTADDIDATTREHVLTAMRRARPATGGDVATFQSVVVDGAGLAYDGRHVCARLALEKRVRPGAWLVLSVEPDRGRPAQRVFAIGPRNLVREAPPPERRLRTGAALVRGRAVTLVVPADALLVPGSHSGFNWNISMLTPAHDRTYRSAGEGYTPDPLVPIEGRAKEVTNK